MDYKTKYEKYKQKYLNLQSDIKFNIVSNKNLNKFNLTGGSKPFDKYILLSCKEFDGLVDQIIMEDREPEGIKYKIINESGNSEEKTLTGSVNEKDSDLSTIDINKYKLFLEEIGIKTKESEADFEKYKKPYMRKVYNYETKHYFRGFINWKSYNDNTPDIKMNSSTVSKLRGAKIIYFAYFSFNEPVTMMITQLLFLNSLNHYGVSEINIVLPYFPLGTMERIVGEGEIPTAFAFANMLNSIPSGASKNNIYIFDIHALCSRFFFHTNTIPILITLMPDYLKYIETTYPQESNLNVIVFPDDGAKKRFDKLVPSSFKKITCGKTRKNDERIIKIESGMDNLTEKGASGLRVKRNNQINMFILDDLVQSGGTLTESIKGIISYLKSECPEDSDFIDTIKFDTLVTHSVFPKDENLVKFFNPSEHVNKLVTSDSRPLRVNYIKETYSDKISVIPIAPVLHKIFTKTDYEKYVAPYSVN